jgi:hypothetical protein
VINIISAYADATTWSGPGKVFLNTAKGLKAIGYPFVVNRSIKATNRIWVQSDRRLVGMVAPAKDRALVVGPNTAVLPDDLDGETMKQAVYLQPCEWAAKLWEDLGWASCEIIRWPCGIDTEVFPLRACLPEPTRVLVYHKERSSRELLRIIEALWKAHFQVELVMYGQYSESEYRSALARSAFVVWHGRHESQGIALQEALSTGTPILVCDVSRIGDQMPLAPFMRRMADYPATAAPYFDERCGVRIEHLRDFDDALIEMVNSSARFRPRDYVLENLSLEAQAHALVAVWERFGLSEAEGRAEKASSMARFRPPLARALRVGARSGAGKIRRGLSPTGSR